MKSFLHATALLSLLSMTTGEALAHKVVSGIYTEGDALEGEIGFSDGSMAANATIEIFNSRNELLLTTTTDEDGVFSFVPEKTEPLTIRANLGSGHVAEIKVSVEDLPLALAGGITPASPDTSLPPDANTASIDQAALQGLIDKAVARQIKPLRKQLAAFEEERRLQDILGGLGYIAGLFGVGFYIASRHRDKSR